MKKLVSALALAILAASPALAATHHKHAQTSTSQEATSAYATTNDANAVIVDGKVVGADPDPNVRPNLLRDPQLQAD